MKGTIYLTGRKTKQASKVKVYKGFGTCKKCGYALDDREAEKGLCKPCEE